MCSSDIFLAILAVFFPPISVWIKVGICTADSIINIALCCLGYIPGLLHAWYIILKYPEPDYDDPNYQPLSQDGRQRRDVENGRATYYYVSHQQIGQRPGQRGYGTVESSSSAPAAPPAATRPSPSAEQAHEAEQESSSQAHPPPTYAEAVKGDHKIQTQD
ncbi:hypothetical protein ASPZODRAFT_126753 [Penicilliopsis zonata CBS 506.65]|uniref:Stress response RCI peptide n=1 Tax=Penicilliopsis zonata CBS 506.65 TaxID=1073090 RepID=A0A1L9SUA7_9EURO|nr:hypothetical protein ASPZODRAFT_126753 [Penicilliopsis zonata CBS 506.65]OJJ50805.1 hypothetical protein ASPZODRAFT_126753 [Penicilliopsis zonata CBS 506.65]